MNIFVGDGSAEFLLQHMVYGMDNKIDHFDRCINDPQFLNHFWESGFKELVVQLNNNPLFTFGIIDTCGTHPDRFVEFLQYFGILFY